MRILPIYEDEIFKKLKLVGQPKEIKKNTTFIKGMFNSRVEVSKFIGAKIQTVSGIRGQIKKAVPKDPGVFRATFESKLVPSDIVFLKGWIPVKVNKFYNPMIDLTGKDWDRMRLSRELRRDHNISLPETKESSKYKSDAMKPKLNENHVQKMERLERERKKIYEQAESEYHVTKKIMRNLPFAEQLKIMEEGAKLSKQYVPKPIETDEEKLKKLKESGMAVKNKRRVKK